MTRTVREVRASGVVFITKSTILSLLKQWSHYNKPLNLSTITDTVHASGRPHSSWARHGRSCAAARPAAPTSRSGLPAMCPRAAELASTPSFTPCVPLSLLPICNALQPWP